MGEKTRFRKPLNWQRSLHCHFLTVSHLLLLHKADSQGHRHWHRLRAPAEALLFRLQEGRGLLILREWGKCPHLFLSFLSLFLYAFIPTPKQSHYGNGSHNSSHKYLKLRGKGNFLSNLKLKRARWTPMSIFCPLSPKAWPWTWAQSREVCDKAWRNESPIFLAKGSENAGNQIILRILQRRKATPQSDFWSPGLNNMILINISKALRTELIDRPLPRCQTYQSLGGNECGMELQNIANRTDTDITIHRTWGMNRTRSICPLKDIYQLYV